MDFWRAKPPFIYGMWLNEECVAEDELDEDVRGKLDQVAENGELSGFLESAKRRRAQAQAGPDMLDGREWGDWIQDLVQELTAECQQHLVPLAIQGVIWRWLWSPRGTSPYQCVPKDFMRAGLLGAEKFTDPEAGLWPSPNIGWDGKPTSYVVIRVDVNATVKDLETAFGTAKRLILGDAAGKRGKAPTLVELAYTLADSLGEAILHDERPSGFNPNRWTTIKGDWRRYLESRVVTEVLARAVQDLYGEQLPEDEKGMSLSTARASLKKDHTSHSRRFLRRRPGDGDAT